MDWADRIGRRIRLRDLHILLAVAESGSMAKASARLAISHPVVSKTISDLEHSLGVRLFDRNSQGVELTTYGRALLKCGVTVFDEMRQGLKQIEFLADPDSGELRVCCPDFTMAGLMPAITERFSRQYPGIRLHVTSTGALQFQELRERNVELFVGRLPRAFLDDDLIAEILFDESFVAVAGVRSQWARRQHIKFAELINEVWVLPPYDTVPGSLIVEIFRAANLQPPPARMVTLSVQLMTTVIATGRYLGLVPRSAVQFSGSRAGLKILPVKLPARRTAVGIVTVKNRTLSPLAMLFIGCAREVVKPLARGE